MGELCQGSVDLFLNGLNEFGLFLKQLAFRAEILHLEVLGFLFLIDDVLLTSMFLVFGEKHHFGLVFLVHLRHLVVDGLHFVLPLGGEGVEFFLSIGIFRDVAQDVV